MTSSLPHGRFFDHDKETWYRIDGYDQMPPFLVALATDSDLWAYISTSGSLAAGRCDQERSFFPYETVDKLHTRWESTGPRTWIECLEPGARALWEPFARRPGHRAGLRSIAKNLSGTRLRFEETNSAGNLCFSQEWSSAGTLGLVRKITLRSLRHPQRVRVLDGLLNLNPPGVSNATYHAVSSLADAYKWNELHGGGRLGLFTLYAQLWDRAEPKESFAALAAWHSPLPGARTLLSAAQVEAFCRGEDPAAESLVRGRRGAFLQYVELEVGPEGVSWYQVIDGPLSQAKAADLEGLLEHGWGSAADIEAALAANDRGLGELLAQADGLQSSANPMVAFHHTANVLFNIMRGGVFIHGTAWDKRDLLAFIATRNRELAQPAAHWLADQPEQLERGAILAAATAQGPQLARLVREYLPLTYSRRHGDPSRPWNRFSIHVRDDAGARVLNHQGNWRDIFQNWEALLWSEPDYIEAVIATFLSAMTVDGYNPYRIMRDGIDWEVLEEDDPWSYVGYWGDHQVVYLLRLLELSRAAHPGALEALWHAPGFAFANVPYRIKPYADLLRNPKATIEFDDEAHATAMREAARLGGDGKLLLDASGMPVLASLAEKLLTIVLAKAGNLVPGGGLWLNTQRPEWNDANNALVGNGLSIVTLAALRRLLALLAELPGSHDAIELPEATAAALEAMRALAERTPLAACADPQLRREWMDAAGGIMESWRAALYRNGAQRRMVACPPAAFRRLIAALLPLVDRTLADNRRDDGLFHSYNLLSLAPGRAEVGFLYPMLEGQVAMLGSGLLDAEASLALCRALRASALYSPAQRSYLLYPDRRLPGFLERNVLDEQALACGAVRALLDAKQGDIFERQADGRVRFASALSNRDDLEQALARLPSGTLDATQTEQIVAVYERIMRHREFTGRSGTMFAYEGLGCIYWHMVAKLLLAIQEAVWQAHDAGSPHLAELLDTYREIRAGLGYKKTPEEYGAFPYDPYSHTGGEGGAQQPGMTGQVKEEVLTRWGELGLRWIAGQLTITPLLLDRDEIPADGALSATYRRLPIRYRRAATDSLRVRTAEGWQDCANAVIPFAQALEVEVGLA